MREGAPPSLRVAVLASGRGSNLAALIRARDAGRLGGATIALVASNKAGAPALDLARDAGIATLCLLPRNFASRADYDHALFAELATHDIDLVVLAGFMRVLDGDAIAPWNGRIINIHPSLLPRYRGLDTHRRALDAGDALHGASVHFLNAELDDGPLIAQARLAIEPGDDPERLAARLLPIEHRLLPAVVAAIADGRVRLGADGVTWCGKLLHAPLGLDENGLHSDP